jgi:hypothetical protein
MITAKALQLSTTEEKRNGGNISKADLRVLLSSVVPICDRIAV